MSVVDLLRHVLGDWPREDALGRRVRAVVVCVAALSVLCAEGALEFTSSSHSSRLPRCAATCSGHTIFIGAAQTDRSTSMICAQRRGQPRRRPLRMCRRRTRGAHHYLAVGSMHPRRINQSLCHMAQPSGRGWPASCCVDGCRFAPPLSSEATPLASPDVAAAETVRRVSWDMTCV